MNFLVANLFSLLVMSDNKIEYIYIDNVSNMNTFGHTQ